MQIATTTTRRIKFEPFMIQFHRKFRNTFFYLLDFIWSVTIPVAEIYVTLDDNFGNQFTHRQNPTQEKIIVSKIDVQS